MILGLAASTNYQVVVAQPSRNLLLTESKTVLEQFLLASFAVLKNVLPDHVGRHNQLRNPNPSLTLLQHFLNVTG